MGIFAIAHTVNGTAIVLGMAEISMQVCEIAQAEMCIAKFTSRVLLHRCLRNLRTDAIRVVPIVECNGSDVMGGSYVTAIRQTAQGHGCTYVMPFKKMYFRTAITEDIGIWAGEENKLAAVNTIYTAMVKHQIGFVKNMVTCGPVHLLNPIEPTEKEMKELFRDELVQIRNDEKGRISGKTPNSNDDMTLAAFWAFYYSEEIMKIASRENTLFVPTMYTEPPASETLIADAESMPPPKKQRITNQPASIRQVPHHLSAPKMDWKHG
jgi:hypothetical protein